MSIGGERRYLWRAVDQDGDVPDILIHRRMDTTDARGFLRKLLKVQSETPSEITTDKLGSYIAAKRDVMASVPHCRDR